MLIILLGYRTKKHINMHTIDTNIKKLKCTWTKKYGLNYSNCYFILIYIIN